MLIEIKNYIDALPSYWSELFYSDSFIYFYYVDLYNPNNIDVRMDSLGMMDYTAFNQSGDFLMFSTIKVDTILTKNDLLDIYNEILDLQINN